MPLHGVCRDAVFHLHDPARTAVTRMRAGLVFDSACDLPPSSFGEQPIEILSLCMRIDDLVQVNDRNARARSGFLHSQIAETGAGAETTMSNASLRVRAVPPRP